MRLIDADAFEEFTRKQCSDSLVDLWCELIKRQPTAYDLDAAIRQLEGLRDGVVEMNCCPYVENDDVSCERCYMETAIEIVRSGGRLCGEGSI